MLETTNNRVSLLSALTTDSSKESGTLDFNLNDKEKSSDDLDENDPTTIFNEFLSYLNNPNTEITSNQNETDSNLKDIDNDNLNLNIDLDTLSSSTSNLSVKDNDITSNNDLSNTSTDNFKDLQPLLGSMIPSLRYIKDSNQEQESTNTEPIDVKENNTNTNPRLYNNFNLNETVLNRNDVSTFNTYQNTDLNNTPSNLSTSNNSFHPIDNQDKYNYIHTDSNPSNIEGSTYIDSSLNKLETSNNESKVAESSTLDNTLSSLNSYPISGTSTIDNTVSNVNPYQNTSNSSFSNSSSSPIDNLNQNNYVHTASNLEGSTYLDSFLNKPSTTQTNTVTETSPLDSTFSKMDLRSAPTLSIRSNNEIKDRLKQNYNTVNDISYNKTMADLSKQALNYTALSQRNTNNTNNTNTANVTGNDSYTNYDNSNNYIYTNNSPATTLSDTDQYFSRNLTTPIVNEDSDSNLNNTSDTSRVNTRSRMNLDTKLTNTKNSYKNLDSSFNLDNYLQDSTTKDSSTTNSSFYLSDNIDSVKKDDLDLKLSSFKENISNITINRIVQESKILINQGQSKADIDLSLYGLGKLSISINKNNKDLNLKIETDSNQVKELLSENIVKLKENLSQQNIEFKAIDIQNHSEKNWNFISSNNDLNSNTDSNSSNNTPFQHNSSNSQSGSNLSYNEGHNFFDSSNKYTDTGFESSSTSGSTEEKISDSSYSKRKIQHNGKIQVLI